MYPLGERQPQYRTVRRIVDGDTLILENKERVRLIGVDTPETKHPRKPVEYFGKEATAFTKKMVYGFAYTRFPFKYMDEFRRYEREAREQGRGLWGKTT